MSIALTLYGNVIVDEIEFRILSHDKTVTRRKEVVESV